MVTLHDTVPQRQKTVIVYVTGGDIARVKQKAARKKLPYKTLIASIIRQYATDQLGE